MSAAAVPCARRAPFSPVLGRAFVHPIFDVLLIGGGLSLALAPWLWLGGASRLSSWLGGNLWVLVLLCNSAHFAASTVRLYSKPGTLGALPFLTLGLPLATLGALLLALAFPEHVGRHLMALYLTWSPYHYAAQAYGLAVMYWYRTGSEPGASEKRWLWLACLLPFAYAFLNARGVGIEWFLPERLLDGPGNEGLRTSLVKTLAVLSLAAPLALFLKGQLGAARMPIISLLVLLANGVWWVAFTYVEAFVWATIFHGLQYLAIVTIFQVKEDLRRAGPALPWWRPAARFYLTCLALGFLLFQAWPHAFVMAGFSYAQSLLLVIAVVNIHHFVVDAFIWRLRQDPNYAVVRGDASTA